jgi:hypothetical protein
MTTTVRRRKGAPTKRAGNDRQPASPADIGLDVLPRDDEE